MRTPPIGEGFAGLCKVPYAVASAAVKPYAVGVAVISVLKFADHASSAASALGRNPSGMLTLQSN